MIQFIFGALAAIGISELSKFEKKAHGGNIGRVYIDFLNKKKNFQRDRKYFESYEKAREWALKNFEKFHPDMIKTEYAKGGVVDRFKDFYLNKEGNFEAIINGKKYQIIYRDDVSQMYDLFQNGKLIDSSKSVRDVMKFAKGGGVGNFLHLYKLTYPDGFYIVESYDGEYMSPKEAMEKMRINIKNFKSYKYKGVSSESPKYKEWNDRKDIGYSNTEAWDEVFEGKFAKGGVVGKERVGTKEMYFKYDEKTGKKSALYKTKKEAQSSKYEDGGSINEYLVIGVITFADESKEKNVYEYVIANSKEEAIKKVKRMYGMDVAPDTDLYAEIID